MKKLIALSIVLVLVSAVVFAQDSGLTFAGWGRGIFAPIVVDKPDGGDSKTYATTGKNWGDYPRVGFSLIGDWEKVGAQADLFFFDADDATVSIGDFAYVWAKPWNFLKVSIGKYNDDTLRGKFGDTNFSWGVTLGMSDEDALFTRFQGNGLGAEIALTPIEGLYIAANANVGGFATRDVEAKYAYRSLQIGAGYEIANIGHARAQFINGSGALDLAEIQADLMAGEIPQVDAQRAELAFALTAVENLTIDLGAKIWFPVKKQFEDGTQTTTESLDNNGSYSNPFGLSLAAGYDLDAFNITARIDTKIGGGYKDNDIKVTSGFGLNAHLVPSYNLGFAVIGADIGFAVNPKIESTYNSITTTEDEGGIEFGLGAWIQRDLGNGLIKTGLGVALPTTAHKLPNGAGGRRDVKADMVLTIPVIIEYWF